MSGRLEALASRVVWSAGTLDQTFGRLGRMTYAIVSPDAGRVRAADARVVVAVGCSQVSSRLRRKVATYG